MTIGQRIADMLAEVDLVDVGDTDLRCGILRTHGPAILADIPGLSGTGVDIHAGEMAAYAAGWSPSLHRVPMRTVWQMPGPNEFDAAIQWFAGAATRLWRRSLSADALGMESPPPAATGGIMHLDVDASLIELHGGDVLARARQALKTAHGPRAAGRAILGDEECGDNEGHVRERGSNRQVGWSIDIEVDDEIITYDGVGFTIFGQHLPDVVAAAACGRPVRDLVRTGTCLDYRIIEDVQSSTPLSNGCFHSLRLRQEVVPLASLAS